MILNHYGNFWKKTKLKMKNKKSIMETNGESILISESDLMVFLEAIENPVPPNDKLKESSDKYKKFIQKDNNLIKL